MKVRTVMLPAVLAGVAALVLQACSKPAAALAARSEAQSNLAIDCAQVLAQQPVVVLVLGQSNAANHGQAATSVAHPVFTTYRGQCYWAHDPLPGASGNGGSPWPQYAQLLIEAKLAKSVLIVNRAVTATSIKQWTEPALFSAIEQVSSDLTALKLRPTLLLFQQGEADAREATPVADFERDLKVFLGRLRGVFPHTPILLSQSSICRNAAHAGIRGKQAEVVSLSQQIYPGPDTDRIAERHDGCHFSSLGLQQLALAWFDASKAHFSSP